MTKAISNYPAVMELFDRKDIKAQIARVLPRVLTADNLIRVSLTLIRNNPKLLECSQQSLLGCLMGCAQLGLTPDPFLGQVYFVPFWNSGLQSLEATLIPGYRGYITLAKRSGELANLSADVVCQNDQFRMAKGLVEELRHVPAISNRGEVIGAWTVFRYRNSYEPTFEFMNRDELEAIKNRTKSRDKNGNIVGPWVETEETFREMCKKTVIRRHMKLASLSPEDNRLYLASQAESLALESPESASRLFLPMPEESEEPKKKTDAQIHSEFKKEFSDLDEKMLTDFVIHSADFHKTDGFEVMSEALGAPKSFRDAFAKFLDSRKTSKKATPKSKHDRPDASQAKKTRSIEYQDKGDGAKTSPRTSEAPRNQNGDHQQTKGVQSDDFDKLIHSDEWNEMSALKSEYPEIFKEVTKGKMPKNKQEVEQVIEKMTEFISQESAGENPFDE